MFFFQFSIFLNLAYRCLCLSWLSRLNLKELKLFNLPIFSFDDPSMIFNLKFYHRFELISDPQFFLALFIVYNTVNDTVVSTIIASYLIKVVKSQLLNSNTLQIILIFNKSTTKLCINDCMKINSCA